MKRTHFGVEQKAVVIADMATGNMLEVQLHLIKNLGKKQQAIINLLSLKDLDGHFIINYTNIDLNVLGLSLKPRAS